jgi:hypothetical protein
VAQSGSALGWGPSGRRFKSCLPDVGLESLIIMSGDALEIELIFEPQEEREDGESLDMGIVRRRITLPA